jgi:metal-sulfur cluster biosynthetic enzyme
MPTIDSKTNVHLSVIGSAVGLAMYGTVLYCSLVNRVNNGVTRDQMQTWIFNQAEVNRTNSIEWTPFPAKTETGNSFLSTYVLKEGF